MMGKYQHRSTRKIKRNQLSTGCSQLGPARVSSEYRQGCWRRRSGLGVGRIRYPVELCHTMTIQITTT